MTPEVIVKLETAFAQGCNDLEACFFADLTPTVLYDYQKKHPEFCHRKNALKTRPVLIARQSVISTMKEDGWLAFKYLERKRPEEFGDKTAVQIPTVNVSISFEKKLVAYAESNPDAKVHLLQIAKMLRESDGPEQAHA